MFSDRRPGHLLQGAVYIDTTGEVFPAMSFADYSKGSLANPVDKLAYRLLTLA